MDSVGIAKVMLCILVAAVTYGTDRKCDPGQFQCESGECIPPRWQCDSDRDCLDGSDELRCTDRKCDPGQFQCESGECIPPRWQCDGDRDCPDSSDERGCPDRKCDPGQFKCESGECIHPRWQCDGDRDCLDGSDELRCTDDTLCAEKNCEVKCVPVLDDPSISSPVSVKCICGLNQTLNEDGRTCRNASNTGDSTIISHGKCVVCDSKTYICTSDERCIPISWRCDGEFDCSDGSDEEGCFDTACGPERFKCMNSGVCLPIKWRCDKERDCFDGSDEIGCDVISCYSKTSFQCLHNKTCVPIRWKCDGKPDCPDLSDETECSEIHCHEDDFKCHDNKTCIKLYKKCDDDPDCPDASDELGCDLSQTCTDKTFGCQHGVSCIPIQKRCDGKPDCADDSDEHQCPDNLCAMKDCEVTCDSTNNQLPVTCSCGYNQTLNEDGRTCRNLSNTDDATSVSYEKDEDWLYFSTNYDIRRVNLNTLKDETVITRALRTWDYDVDLQRGIVFRSELAGRINKVAINRESGVAEEEMTVIDGRTSPSALAVDWLYKHIYWMDYHRGKVMVANYDGTKVKTLTSGDISEPNAIVVDPENGYLYFTVWGYTAKIERVGMNGESRAVLLQGNAMLRRPDGLTLDYNNQRLFWCDSRKDKLGTMNVDGSNAHFLLDTIKHPHSITVLGDRLFWSELYSIYVVNKTSSGARPKALMSTFDTFTNIKAFNRAKHSSANLNTAELLCAQKNCEFMCLPAPRETVDAHVHDLRVTCVCADNQTLGNDGRTCRST